MEGHTLSLTDQQTREVIKQLNSQLAELEQDLKSGLDDIRQDSLTQRGGTDSGDESEIELETLLNVDKASRKYNQYSQVKAALKRFRNGEFGSCSECNAQIDSARLLANPLSTRCLDCQSDSENRQQEKDATPSL